MTSTRAHPEAFETAWHEFTQTCADTVAPEATYQAWLAHFVIQKVDLLHVVREVDFGARHLGPEARTRFPRSNLMVDLLVLRQPVVNLPRRTVLGGKNLPDGQPNPRSGLGRVGNPGHRVQMRVAAKVSPAR